MTVPVIDIVKRGSVETKEFLATAVSCHQAHHATLRSEGLDLVRALNAYRSAVIDLRTRLHASEIAETDAAIAGKFHEIGGHLRTAERLSDDVTTSINQLTRHMQQVEASHKDLDQLTDTPIAPESTT